MKFKRVTIMSRLLWNALKASPAILGAFFLVTNHACATQISASEIVFGQTVPSTEENLIKSSTVVTSNPETQSSSPKIEESIVHLTASEHNATLLVELVAQADGQLLQTGVAESNLPSVTHRETSPTVELADSTPAQVMPVEEVTITDSTSILEQINLYSTSDGGSGDNLGDEVMEQVTNVSQLTDVAPGDWAYEALRSLVERYGCIAGYPDRTFRGNRATSRYEFAAGLNACLNQIERLIAASTSDFVRRQDLEVVQQLVREFQTELATLGTRIDTLEGRVAFLEDRQFSVTTRLTGNVDFGLLDAWGDKKAVPSGQIPTEDLNVNTIFPGRVGLNFDTSFTGTDRLRTKLEAGNFTPFNRAITGTDMTLYDFDTRTGPTGNSIVLGTLAYQFPIGNVVQVFIAPQGLGSPDVAPQLNPATGVFSRFGQRNPIYRLSDGAGLGLNFRFSDALQASFTYLVEPGILSKPDEKRGLFDGQFGALAQLTFSPTQSLSVAFTYVRFFSPEPGQGINVTGNTGSLFAQRPFGEDAATSANAYGIEGQYRITPRFAIGGWVGVTKAEAESAGALARQGAEAEIWNYAVILAFPDLGGQGNSLGLIFGMPPRARGNDVVSRRDLDTSYRAEAFYRLKLTDNISITPGFFAVFNPEHNKANDTIYVGTLLTTFSF
jgi:hypothetical protein